MLAAFAFAFASVVLWWAVARGMDRRGIYLKV
jgi:predicted acyltransferase